ncbi:MAG: cytochrome C [Verrucomicrobia bacterium]|nr:cytochrome C [Verrucomicrobiota bacterium]
MESNKDKKSSWFSFYRSWLSLLGLFISIASFVFFLLLFGMDITGEGKSPYLAILTFIIAPAFLILGLLMIILGAVVQRRRFLKSLPGERPAFLAIDFGRPAHRRNFVMFLILCVIFFLFTAIGSYKAYKFSESIAFCGQTCHVPMKPEFTAYQFSPHSQIKCVECHVGPGPEQFIKAKLNGIHQLTATLSDSFPRPIHTSIENLPSTAITCEECHWPEKYIGNIEKTTVRYKSDSANTAQRIRMSINVGGGDPVHGPVGGIHWYMNLANKIEYIATDERLQDIPWMRVTDTNGNQRVYATSDFEGNPAEYKIHEMNCTSCHNRPAHQINSPADVVDKALQAGVIDPGLKSIKKNVVTALTQEYATEGEALEGIAAFLNEEYKDNDQADKVVSAAQSMFKHNFFPEMKADWKAYPNNIGHKTSKGCFRCHDGKHKEAETGEAIKSDCNTCHTILGQAEGDEISEMEPKGQAFMHLGFEYSGNDCFTCHEGSIVQF